MSIYIQKLLEARAASRELRQTKGTEDSPITGKETRFVPTSSQEEKLSLRARLKLDSHRRRLAKRTQDVADDAEEQSKTFKSGSSMKESLQRSLSRLFSEAKRFKHSKTAKFLTYRQGKQTEKASKELERTTKTPDKFEKKVDKLMGKKKYNTQTPSEMWREIHDNAKKGVEEYKRKRDAQERADAEMQSESYRKGSSMKESVYMEIGYRIVNENEDEKKPKSSQEEAKERRRKQSERWQRRRDRWKDYSKSLPPQPKPPQKEED